MSGFKAVNRYSVSPMKPVSGVQIGSPALHGRNTSPCHTGKHIPKVVVLGHRRGQPYRDSKVVPSIEGRASRQPTPAWGEPFRDQDWTPPDDDFERLSYGSSPRTLSTGRRGHSKARQLSNTYVNSPGSSSESPLRAQVKEENSDADDLLRLPCNGPRIPSPTQDADLQQTRLEENGYFELHKSDVLIMKWKEAEKRTTESGEQAAALKAAYERHILENRTAKGGQLDSEQTSSDVGLTTRGFAGLEEASLSSKKSQQPSTEKVPKKSIQSAFSKPHRHDLDLHVDATGPKTPRAMRTQPDINPCNRPSAFEGSHSQKVLQRREIDFPSHRCKCEHLHPYFSQRSLRFPSLASFEGSTADFLSHAEKIAKCSWHDQTLVKACQNVLENEHASRQNDTREDSFEDNVIRSAIDVADEWLSKDSHSRSTLNSTRAIRSRVDDYGSNNLLEHGDRLRQQSSIEASSFYGQQPSIESPGKAKLSQYFSPIPKLAPRGEGSSPSLGTTMSEDVPALHSIEEQSSIGMTEDERRQAQRGKSLADWSRNASSSTKKARDGLSNNEWPRSEDSHIAGNRIGHRFSFRFPPSRERQIGRVESSRDCKKRSSDSNVRISPASNAKESQTTGVAKTRHTGGYTSLPSKIEARGLLPSETTASKTEKRRCNEFSANHKKQADRLQRQDAAHVTTPLSSSRPSKKRNRASEYQDDHPRKMRSKPTNTHTGPQLPSPSSSPLSVGRGNGNTSPPATDRIGSMDSSLLVQDTYDSRTSSAGQPRDLPVSSTNEAARRSLTERERQRKRCQSMPAPSFSCAVDNGARDPQPSPAIMDCTPREIPINEPSRKNMLDRMDQIMEEKFRKYIPALNASANAHVPPPTPASTQTSSSAPVSRKKKYRPSLEARRAKRPMLSDNVPEHERLSDDEIVEVGKVINGYERHKAAPYAFGVGGRLKAQYKYLLDLHGEDGLPVWTPDEISRILC